MNDRGVVAKALADAAPKSMTLYEVIAATGLCGWNAGQELKALCAMGQARESVEGLTTHYVHVARR